MTHAQKHLHIDARRYLDALNQAAEEIPNPLLDEDPVMNLFREPPEVEEARNRRVREILGYEYAACKAAFEYVDEINLMLDTAADR